MIETLLLIFAIIVSLGTAVWFFKRGRGCLAVISAIVVFFALSWVFSIVDAGLRSATKWRDARLAKRAKQAEIEKAQKAEAERIAAAKRRQEAAAAAAEQKRLAKDEKIQTFALKEAPKVWEVYQSLQSEIDVQNGKIEELRKTLLAFDKVPEQDADFKRICALRDEMIRSRKALRAKLEDAYIAAKKYEVSPSRKDYQELHKKALKDGILEATVASEKFKEMRLNK